MNQQEKEQNKDSEDKTGMDYFTLQMAHAASCIHALILIKKIQTKQKGELNHDSPRD